MSNLTKALAVVTLLAPATGRPLSIGDIELHSALNQHLNAEIRLHLDPGENIGDITVRMAPPEKFDKAGIPWNYFVSKIKLNPITDANGNVIVKLTSTESLSEPFLDFLLEVSWPQGNQFREFTALVDPPAAYNPSATHIAENTTFHAEPIEQAERSLRRARPANHSKPTNVTTEINPQTPSSGEFGPTQSSDTLWSIASKLANERGVSPQQMMYALFKANPEAFNRRNMNSLKVGVSLKIPETQAIAQRTENKQSVRTQQKTNRTEASTKPLELLAPVDSKIADNAVVSGKVKPGKGNGTNGLPASSEAGQEAEAKDLELQAKVEKLEQQLGMMQQLLALKDQQLATLQHNAKPADTAQSELNQAKPAEVSAEPQVQQKPAEPVKAVEPSSPAAVTPPSPPAVKPPVTPTPAKTAPQVPSNPATTDEGIDPYYLTVGGLGAGILGILGWLLWRKRRIEDQINTESMFSSASQIRMPDSESSLSVPVIDLDSSAAYDVGTVGESSFISDFTPSDFDAFDTDQNEVDPLSEADVYLAYGRYQQAEELIRNALNEEPAKDAFKLKLLEIFYAGENKSGFSAYAEELAALGKQDDKPFWNKVSEMAKELIPDSALFGGSGTSDSAIQLEKAAPADFTTKDMLDEEVLSHEPELDQDQIDDNHPDQFSTTIERAGLESETDRLHDIDLDFADFSKSIAVDAHNLEFDNSALSSSTSLSVDEEHKIEANSTDIESIDFDLSSFSFEDEPIKIEEKQDISDIESFDFDFDVEPVQNSAETGKTETLEDLQFDASLKPALTKAGDLDNTLDTDDFFSKPTSADSENILHINESDSGEETLGEFEFNFDFDAPLIKGSDPVDFDLGVSDLTDMDEFETKIDLAKAYVDMGDAEAARSIAEEVLKKGTKEQQAVAQALLDELS